MLIEGKEIFKDFMESEEVIVINIFLAKFKILVELGIVIKIKWLDNKKMNFYLLIDKGLVLMFVFVEFVVWSDGFLRDIYLDIVNGEVMEWLWKDKVVFVCVLEEKYREKLVGFVIV